jgi:hypothetical protein
VPEQIISTVVKKLYTYTIVVLKIGKEKREIKYKVGVNKQGNTMVPVMFICLMNVFVETLQKTWNVETLQYKWFPKSKQSGNKRGKLLGQKRVGTSFDLFYLL